KSDGMWIILNNHDVYEAEHGDYRTVMRFLTGKYNEYFLVENRHQEGLDKHLPDTGLAVYHCDTRGSNEHQDGTPENHYQCALIQADGHFDLESSQRGGDEGDLYASIHGIALSDVTVPNSNEWDGSDSGLVISGIGPSASKIAFRTGATLEDKIVHKNIVADQLIPDDDEAGIESSITIDPAGSLVNIRVKVQISHTYRGDLNVQLVAPSGKIVTLHSGQGGTLDNLALDLDPQSFSPLNEFKGEAIQGPWLLHVRDLWQYDVGRLDTWSLTIEYE
ncbi:MAG: hypothetical protein ETSY2_49645, partial [Candidatus Entotheonella gemina]